MNWTVDTLAFLAAGRDPNLNALQTRWDYRNAWAPSIVVGSHAPSENGADSTYMFYAGADNAQQQAIGYAAIADLDSCGDGWVRRPFPTWTPLIPNWAAKRGQGGIRICRDPYVWQDPDSDGVYFMLYVAGDSANVTGSGTALNVPQAVGIARNRNRYSLDQWLDIDHFVSTDIQHNERTAPGFAQIEGPTIFPDRGTPRGWVMMFTNPAPAAAPLFHTVSERLAPGHAPREVALANWSHPPDTVWQYLHEGPADSTTFGWQGTEYLKIKDGVELLAGFTSEGIAHAYANNPNYSNGAHWAQGIAIAQIGWSGHEFSLGLPGNVTAVNYEGAPNRDVRMRVVEYRPGAHRVSWRITAPASIALRLSIYDVMGRLVRTVAEERVPIGSTFVTWNMTGPSGETVGSGVYYARLTFDGGARVQPLAIVR